jgi:spore maturation protein CgeB
LRDENWLDAINPTKIQGLTPDELGKIYRGAQICPNIHGKFQQGEVSREPSTLADVPGFACNERLFQITGSGGFQIADNNPQIKEFFEDDELVTATDAEDFKTKIQFFLDNPQEKESYIENGKLKVLTEHTYHHRCADLIRWLEEL